MDGQTLTISFMMKYALHVDLNYHRCVASYFPTFAFSIHPRTLTHFRVSLTALGGVRLSRRSAASEEIILRKKADEEITTRDAPSPMEAVLGLLNINKGAVKDQECFLMM